MNALIDLAHELLRHESICLGRDIPAETLHLATHYMGVGLDHLEGEVPLALIDESGYLQATHAITSLGRDGVTHFDGALLTTRRLIVAGPPSRELPLEAIQRCTVGGTILKDARLHTARGVVKLELDCYEHLVRFFDALCRMPPQARILPGRPRAVPTEHDPLGAMALEDDPAAPDDGRASTISGLAKTGFRAGILSREVAADLVQRATLFDQNAGHGRGMRGGHWMSPLPADDLAHVACLLFGQPSATRRDAQGALYLRFTRRGSLGRAAVSSALGLAASAVTGFGWTTTPEKSDVTFKIVQGGPIAYFTVSAATGSMLTLMRPEDRSLLQYLHGALPSLEGRVLLLRSMFGWTTPVPELLASVSPEGIAEHLRARLGIVHLEPFLGDARFDGLDPALEAEVDEAIRAERAKSPEQRDEEARAAWQRALAGGDREVMREAAFELFSADLLDDAVAAYQEVGRRFPNLASDSAQMIGDCLFFKAYGRDMDPALVVQCAQQAVQWYEHAMSLGESPERIEENYYCTIELWAERADGPLASHLYSQFLERFPNGERRQDALEARRQVARLAG